MTNKIRMTVGKVFLIIMCTACSNVKNDRFSDSDSTATAVVPVNNVRPANPDTSFEARNYLMLSNVHSGAVFEDSKTGNSLFFRIAEIEEEEHVSVYIEKISIGEEGGSYKLINRYKLVEKMLGLSNFSLHSVDSLIFVDSTTIAGYFNDIRYTIDLNNKSATKN